MIDIWPVGMTKLKCKSKYKVCRPYYIGGGSLTDNEIIYHFGYLALYAVLYNEHCSTIDNERFYGPTARSQRN